jgi:hypothetical protein
MIKKTLYFGNPYYLSCRNDQLIIEVPHAKGIDKMLNNTVHVEDNSIMCITDKQFGMMEIFYGRKVAEKETPLQQLELF